VRLGDSISVSGICLTVVDLTDNGFWTDVSRETVNNTVLLDAKQGTHVNLEKAITLTTRIGGHLVCGHVDGTGTISGWRPDGRSWWLQIQAPDTIIRYIAAKGSICVDGVSLTVNQVNGTNFQLNIVPYTLAETTLADFKIGQRVNLEVDLIARYLERLFLVNRFAQPASTLTEAILRKHGFWK
jgi:riboflavin synthase